MKSIDINNLKIYREISGHQIVEGALIIWPPLWENHPAAVDISMNLTFALPQGNKSFTITTDANCWTTTIREESTEHYPLYPDFEQRLEYWMKYPDDDFPPLIPEKFNIATIACLKDILGKKITKIQFIDVDDGVVNPYGIILHFSDNTQLISSSNGGDGNMICFEEFMKEFDPFTINSFVGKTVIIDLEDILE